MACSNHRIARDFITAFFDGTLTEDFLTPDVTVWTTLGPLAEKAAYVSTVKNIISLFGGGAGSFDYIIDAITAEEDRAVVEMHAKGTFPDGTDYENAYVFVLRIRDGRIASVAEHFNPIPALEKLFPRLESPPPLEKA